MEKLSSSPELMALWDSHKNQLNPKSLTLGSNRMAWWRCEAYGHSWPARIAHVSGGSRCGVCDGKIVLKGFNDLASKQPALASQWSKANSLQPEEVFWNTTKTFLWLCDESHSWSATPKSRNRGNGCPYCANQAVWPGWNDLASQFPLTAADWSSQNLKSPDQIYALSATVYEWTCSSGHRQEKSVRRRVQNGCSVCHGNGRSWLEQTVAHELGALYKGSMVRNSRPLRTAHEKPLELDFWLPDLNLAFEVNEFNTHHREKEGLRNRWGTVKHGPAYHELKRTLAREQLAAELIFLWEDEIVTLEFKKHLRDLLKNGIKVSHAV